MGRLKYCKTVNGAAKVIDGILIKEKPVVAVKCLGCNLGEKNGRITLVAVRCWDGNIYVFDIYKCPDIMFDGGVMRLLQSAEVLKVFHNCSADSATLTRQFGVKLKHFYDTQIAHALVMESVGLSPRRLSLEQLCDNYNQPIPTPTPTLRRLLGDDMNAWARRPCTEDMLDLAAGYVEPLVPEIFVLIDRNLPTDSNDWFKHQCDVNSRSMIVYPPLRPSPQCSRALTAMSYSCSCDNCRQTIGEMTSRCRSITS